MTNQERREQDARVHAFIMGNLDEIVGRALREPDLSTQPDTPEARAAQELIKKKTTALRRLNTDPSSLTPLDKELLRAIYRAGEDPHLYEDLPPTV